MRIGERILLAFILSFFLVVSSIAQRTDLQFYGADHPDIQYIGRIDFTHPKLPRFWQPGVYIKIRIKGNRCDILLNDELLWGKNHNYVELVVNGKATRLQTKARNDTISVNGLTDNTNTITLCKNTEANIGFLELVGVRCRELLRLAPAPARKIHLIEWRSR